MKKFIKILIFCIAVIVLCEVMISWCDSKIHAETNTIVTSEDDWNNGLCKYDNTKLEYSKTGSKEHYICPTCGKEYVFNSVKSYK